MQYEKFVECLTHLLGISDRINDGWKLNKYEDHVYLVKTVSQILNDEWSDPEPLTSSDDVEVDIQSADVSSVTVRKWEYHIVYSFSYNVPVLYFNVWKSSGELLTLEELWQSINPSCQSQILSNKWFTLTQQEHPYLFQPFFYFHPCDTNNFMKLFDCKDRNTLITWLSSIGQIIWLEMNHEYGKLCSFGKSEF